MARAWDPYSAARAAWIALAFEAQTDQHNSSDGGYGPQTNALNFFGAFSGVTRLISLQRHGFSPADA